ncbi:putative protein [Halioglobus japonicus]|nr:putative protein [Halioglobus japonicus]
MQFAVQLPVDRIDLGAEFSSAQGITECARHVEAAGFNAAFVTDHPAPDDRWLARGGHHSFDPFVALSFAAGCTTSLKLFTNILVLPYRNPLIVAKSAASLDALSNGRMIMGVGAGYLEGEFRACGVNIEERGQLMEEALQAMKLAWSGESFSFKGSHFQADGNTALPRPVQTPHPPIWMGGNSTAAMRRAAQYCDGWLPFPVKGKLASHVRTKELADLKGLENAIADLRKLEQQFDRRQPLDICMIPFGLDMHSGMNWDAGAVLDQCEQLQALGVSWINISLPCDSKSQYFEASSWFAEKVISAMRSDS